MCTPLFDRSPLVKPGSTPLQPTTSAEFKAHHGQRSFLQSKFADFGLVMDNASAQMRQRPPGRWAQHNCLPWRDDYCKSSPPDALYTTTLVLAPPTTNIQYQRQVPYPTPHLDASPQPTHFDADTSYYVDLYDASFVRPRIQSMSDRCSTLKSMHIEMVEQRLRDRLFVPFLEDWDSLTKIQKRDKALYILKEQLRTPITLRTPSNDIATCEEFSRLKKSIAGYFSVMALGGISFIPELSVDGRQLMVHVSGS
jgi:hypothetical protein